VIVIEDHSADNSKKILLDLLKKYPKEFRPVFHEKNMGYGGVLRRGFKEAKKDLVFYTDGDGQYDVKELPILYTLMTKDVNFVNGIKMERQDFVYRVIIGNFYALIMRWAFLLPIYDVDCDFRLIRRSIISKLNLKSSSGSICVELVKKSQRAGAKYRQVSVHHYPRKFGSSQFFNFNRLLQTFKELSLLWWDLMVKEKVHADK
jgi:glycosyltransferase involved in cell wall biosynthesis